MSTKEKTNEPDLIETMKAELEAIRAERAAMAEAMASMKSGVTPELIAAITAAVKGGGKNPVVPRTRPEKKPNAVFVDASGNKLDAWLCGTVDVEDGDGLVQTVGILDVHFQSGKTRTIHGVFHRDDKERKNGAMHWYEKA